ncbi:YopX family protein [Paenibacillus ehimensis]|uniref:YopX family protein n=1 Tax=Paenibacillus ehimensis TaxID=79264 RepID=A0ABT8VLV2_9BACL|nr:YopX family protein [Paenibacillus ehimensis]MDO3681955.1 YopX family protein [Paenibacillus ehimensis]
MREYKFRGICIAEGELKGKFVFGDLMQKNGKMYITPHLNAVEVKGHIGSLIIMHEVDPKTVGQYTGLKDRNGQEIYEGDIVTGKRESHWHGGYDKVYAEIKFSDSTLGFMVDGLGGGPLHDIQDIEVIGNIYENPELLEGGLDQ